jgi:hypothetical protein
MTGAVGVRGATLTGMSGMGHVGGGVGAARVSNVAMPGLINVQLRACRDRVRWGSSLTGEARRAGEAGCESPGSSSSFHVLEFIRVGLWLTWTSVGEIGGEASKTLDGARELRTGGVGKCPIDFEERRFVDESVFELT